MKYKYFDKIVTFDIESTSYVVGNSKTNKHKPKKYAWMYVAALSIDGVIKHFRSWKDVKEYFDFLNNLSVWNGNRRILIWVHNLSFEFQFMKAFLELTEVFCRKAHNVLRCVYGNIEFRDTLALSNCKLEKLAENENLPIKKLVGDLDYSLIRHSETPLTDKEWKYVDNDVLILHYYIKKKKAEWGKLENIPMTSTSEIRQTFINYFNDKGVMKKMHELAMLYSAQTPELQNLLCLIYAGAYTHCNYQAIGLLLEDLFCEDIASDYPYQMVSRKFPTIWFELDISKYSSPLDVFDKYDPEEYAIACRVRFKELSAKHCHNILSLHKAINVDEPVVDNGRIAGAKELTIAVNEIDLKNIINFYDFESFEMYDVYVSKKEYLPKEMVDIILELFRNKTALKDVDGEEENYMRSKMKINGVYGTSVFNIFNTGAYFDEEFGMFDKKEVTFNDFKKYIGNPRTYLWYSIGVWVTSYARAQILEPIKKMSENAIYCDTDSVKGRNKKRYKKLFEHLNSKLHTLFMDAMRYHGYSKEEYTFLDKFDKTHKMGIFEEEDPYRRFKCLGSKRYLVELYKKDEDGNFIMKSTVAGAPKTLWKNLGNNNNERFNNFRNSFSLKECKLTHTYTEDKLQLFVKDYLGNNFLQDVRSGVCLTPADFTINMAPEFLSFLDGALDVDSCNIYGYFTDQQQFKK